MNEDEEKVAGEGEKEMQSELKDGDLVSTDDNSGKETVIQHEPEEGQREGEDRGDQEEDEDEKKREEPGEEEETTTGREVPGGADSNTTGHELSFSGGSGAENRDTLTETVEKTEAEEGGLEASLAAEGSGEEEASLTAEGARGEGGGDTSPQDRERKASKDELLKSAGIQLQGSSEPETEGVSSPGASTEAQPSSDRSLEQFSEILLDSDLSPTNSEAGLSVPEEGEREGEGEGVPGEEPGKNKTERRVRFADEVQESTADTPDPQPPTSSSASSSSSSSSSRPETLATTGPVTGSQTNSPKHPGTPVSPSSPRLQSPRSPCAPHTHEEIVAGVSYSAEYMGSTPIILTGNASAKTARMQQAQQVVKLFKDPENDVLPRFPVTVRISSHSIKIVDSNTGIDLMDHPLYTISYVADIENVLVVMINRVLPPAPGDDPSQGESGEGGDGGDGEVESGDGGAGEGVNVSAEKSEDVSGEGVQGGEGGEESGSEAGQQKETTEPEYNGVGPLPRMTCHVLETNDARHVAMVIGQAFSVAYKEFLRATGISEEGLEQAEYAHILNAQTAPQAELDLLRDRDKIKKLSLAKRKGDILGVMVMESGYGSALPTPVIAHLSKAGSAARSGQLNVGDHIIAINGVNMVGMPVKLCIEQLKKCRYQNLVKMTVVSCPAVVDITIVRPDLKYQLGFTIQDGVVRSLTRGSIAERSGVRVGHYIIEINGTSTVGLSHKDLVHLLTTTVGDLHLKTMPLLMYKLITGQVIPLYH